MHIILGGTGHVGSATAAALLKRGEPVTIVARHRERGAALARAGATIAVADVHDVSALRAILQTGQRAFLLNPPADFRIDTDLEERRTAAAIVDALDGSGLEKVVAASTYGAKAGEHYGDLNTLFELEEGLRAQPIPVSINRAAYYYTNWDAQAQSVRERGVLQSFFPADFSLPMVSPEDLGDAAARRLTEPVGAGGIHYVEGPERYSPQDVANAYAAVLNRPVKVEMVPRSQWEAAYRSLGFSEPAAYSYARMTAASIDDGFTPAAQAERGKITLKQHIVDLEANRAGHP